MHTLSKVLFAIVLSLFSATVVYADPLMSIGGEAWAPIGHIEFCKLNPSECGTTDEAAPLYLSKDALELLNQVNQFYNGVIKPASDKEIYSKEEWWSYPQEIAHTHTYRGDCEDYVLAKRRALIEHSIAASSLLITVVKDEHGEGHAVLTVETNQGDFILDNRKDEIVRWDETNYTFLTRQSSSNAGQWVSILKELNHTTASIRK